MKIIKNCMKGILNELKFKNFGFEHDRLEQFCQSQWQRNERSIFFLAYRWIWALFFIGVFLVCAILQFSEGKFFIFLTNWGIFLCLLTNLIAAILVTRWHFNLCGRITTVAYEVTDTEHNDKGDEHQRTPCLIKFYWLLHAVTLSLAFVISTVYWIFLHGKMNKPIRFPVISFITHCLNSVFMMVDFLMVAFPVRLLHTVYAMLLPIIFCLFTVVYYFCDGVDEHGNHYVYPILNWKNPGRGLVTFLGVFGLYLVYGIAIFAIYKLKKKIHRTLRVVWKPQIGGLI